MSFTLPNADFSYSRARVHDLATLTPLKAHLQAPLSGVVLPIMDSAAHTGLAVIKVPFVAFHVTVGKRLSLEAFPNTATLHQVVFHVRRAVSYLFAALLGIPLSLLYPRGVVWLHQQIGLDVLYELPKTVFDQMKTRWKGWTPQPELRYALAAAGGTIVTLAIYALFNRLVASAPTSPANLNPPQPPSLKLDIDPSQIVWVATLGGLFIGLGMGISATIFECAIPNQPLRMDEVD